jgi:hypothetical protein
MMNFVQFCARTALACGAAFALLLALVYKAEAATLADPAPAPDAEFRTSLGRNSFAGTAAAGEHFVVKGAVTLPSGERFAQVEKDNRLYWLQVEQSEALPQAGATFVLSHSQPLLTQPVTEVMEPEEASEPKQSPDQEGKKPPEGDTSQYPLNTGSLGMHDGCSNFIKSSGAFGSWGKFVMNELNPGQHSNLFRENVADMPKICPRFRDMSETGKKNFWVWLLAAMANEESGCEERITARGVNGTAAGLLQLHLHHESEYGCAPGTNSLRAQDNLKCGLVILNNDVDRTNRVFPSENNYWEVLRLDTEAGQRTYRLVEKYAPCHH